MKRRTKIIIAVILVLLLATTAVIIKGFRDLKEIQRIAGEFNPELLPGVDPLSMKDEQKIFFAGCLEQKFGALKNVADPSAVCSCVAVNMAHYVWPLVPKRDVAMPARLVQLYKNAEEMAAKGAVIMGRCSETSKK